MGIHSKKIHPDQGSMICPPAMINLSEAGSVYIVQHKSKSDSDNNLFDTAGKNNGKTSHLALAIDVTGSSTEEEFIATHFDLCVVSSYNYDTFISPLLKTRSWDHYRTRKIGQIPLNIITAFNMPLRYAKALEHNLLINAYDPLFNINKGPKWSSILNCHTFTRSALQHLGFDFPENVQIISDSVPMAFDMYLNICLVAARATEGTNK